MDNIQPTSDNHFRAGFVAITGLPNVGKSTLLNSLLGVRLSIISPKPQTTRNNITGILNTPGHQTIFVDTPGMLNPRNLFEKKMSGAIERAASEDSDLALLVVEPHIPPPDKSYFFEKLKAISAPLYLVVNKMDLCEKDPAEAGKIAEFFSGMLPVKKTFFVAALGGAGVKDLKAGILAAMPQHPAYYSGNQITDRWERFYAAELIREQIFNLFSEEIPYASAVEIEVFRETEGMPDYILAAVHVARQTQKPIIIGKGGRQIRVLREKAQAALEKFLGRPVKLELQVKVTPDWQNDPKFLKSL
ncbi:MAG: GTPase Era [Elusimicrobia bacterium RIFOXYA12_FULL_51_18]|nr:MAG: GTPase Era [Elusimicrobia bacterium RIFOXYA12_FULL_51_18]OGS30016.1 MAG: GTPase Era [Elusimicrobia bacterium RIFOXYA2_FULL_53_38]